MTRTGSVPMALAIVVAEDLVRAVTNLAPVERDERHRLVESLQHEPMCEERVDDLPDRCDPAAHARMADRRRDLGLKGRECELRGSCARRCECLRPARDQWRVSADEIVP